MTGLISSMIEVSHSSADNLPENISHLHTDIQEPKNMEDLKRMKKQMRDKAIEDMEKEFIIKTLAAGNWNVGRAASFIGIQRTNFYKLINKYNIKLPKSEEDAIGG